MESLITQTRGIIQQAIKVLRVVLYLRVSTEEQAINGKSLDDQRREGERKARDLAAESGADLQLFVFEDHHGGDLIERPILEEVRTFVRETKPDCFICLDPDRFSRSLKIQLIVADEIEENGTRLVFVLQDYDPTDMMSRAFFHFRGLMSELDKAKILDRTSRGKRAALRDGKIPHGLRLFGYDYHTDTKQLVVNEKEAQWVRQIFTWAREERLGPAYLVQRLSAAGVPTKLGGKWRRCVVAGMLRNTAYMGVLIANRKDTRGLDAQRRLPATRRKRKLTAKQRDQSEWVNIPVPSIVTESEFVAVQEIRNTFKRQRKRTLRLLSGVATCGLCGSPMYYLLSRPPDLYFLRCANRYPKERRGDNKNHPCRQKHHLAAPIDKAVWNQIETWLVQPELLRDLLRRRSSDPSPPNRTPNRTESLKTEVVTISDQLRDKMAEQSRILYLVGKGIVHPEVVEPQLAEMTAAIDYLQKRHRDLQQQIERLSDRQADYQMAVGELERIRQDLILQTAEEVRQKLNRLDLSQRRDLVRRLLLQVIILQDGSWEPAPVGLPPL